MRQMEDTGGMQKELKPQIPQNIGQRISGQLMGWHDYVDQKGVSEYNRNHWWGGMKNGYYILSG